MLRKLVLTLSLIFLSIASNSSYADPEKITSFESTITVNNDASIDVTEKISVYAADMLIMHGIVRWLPTTYKDSYGVRHRSTYQLRDVLVNNYSSRYHTKNADDKFAIYIGDRSTILTPGDYTYTIRYHVNNAINFLKDQDELYWNITGNDWSFPIDYVKSVIQIPDGARIIYYSGYTGARGEKGADFSFTQPSDNSIEFETVRQLNPGEGLTVAVSWPKGFIQKPSGFQDLSTPSTSGQSMAALLMLAMTFYYLIAWYYHGGGLNQGTIIPIFEPPLNLSPAATRYIYEMGFDIQTFTAAVVSMAVKGFLTIVKGNSDVSLIKKSDDMSMLSNEEKALAMALFADDSMIELTKDNYAIIRKAKTVLSDQLKSDYLNTYFVRNIFYLIPGVLISILAFSVIILTAEDSLLTLKIIIWMLICGAFGYLILLRALSYFKSIWIDFSFSKIMPALGCVFIAFYFSFMAIHVLPDISQIISIKTFFLLICIIILNIIFFHLMKAPTAQGQELEDHIEGFKLFLGTTERYRLDALNPPKQSPELFEKYLPYAIALGVENQWGEQFTDTLQEAGKPAASYNPTWYNGSWSGGTFSSFSNHLNGTLTGALLVSSIPASSSASGGGGFSGGGGGGGGGGGW